MQTETLEKYLKRKHTDQTATAYNYYINVFRMHRPDARKLLYSDILTYINEIKKNVKDCKNLNVRLASIKRYYDYLIETGKREDHPCKNIRIRRRSKPIQLQDLFTSAELEALLERENRYFDLELRNKVMISLMIHQALSSAELIRLQLNNLNLDEGTIYIKSSPKIASRTLQLRPNQIMLIQKYITISRKNLLKENNPYLLITKIGTPTSVDDIHHTIETLKALYPERSLNPSTIRQSVISNMLNELKIPLEDVQLFAGHRWLSTTEKYRRKDIDQQRALINQYHPLK